ncbi:MAG: hypothetical protein PHG05_02435 [Candidatus Nanoarchaeia archaeon]|nr:hypothetical protein [Candidatus Nanoarchaeia archaeon]
MRKFLISIFLVIVLTGSVFAFMEITNTDLRAKDGEIKYIEDFDEFTNVKTKFSYWITGNNLKGTGNLIVTGINEDNEKVTLNLRLTKEEIIENNGLIMTVANKAKGTYYVKGNKPVKIELEKVIFSYDKSNKKIDIYSEEGLEFSIENMGGTMLN